ncbi:MAG TPA: ATP-binding cassette domain-containing protein [Kofleriaceae bacterium]|nr:ATP-binding cassette domain-containing protein [Kofleriaceae bacterium]
MSDGVLVAERVSIKRGGRTIISAFSLEAGAGEVVGVVGKNGTGKSTLLMAIAGVLEPRDGRITIDGASVWGSSAQRARARSLLGYVPENADPPGFLRANELWALCAASRKTSPPSDELVAALGLDELGELQLERMSLGQRRRACLAAALLGPPRLLVLDEPDNGLDARRLEALVTLVRAHAAAGHAALVATHDRAVLEGLGARVVTLPEPLEM